jgi:hypothetical protein
METDAWYIAELDILRKLYNTLKIDQTIMREYVYELDVMWRAIDAGCGVTEMVIMQSRRDRALKHYLDEYNRLYKADC